MMNNRFKDFKNHLFKFKMDEPPRFCPYCRIIFNNLNLYEVKENNKFVCNSCTSKKLFSHDTYKSEQKNGQNYKIDGVNDKKKINEFILGQINDLRKEGFSLKQIAQITHFSETRICYVMKKFKNEPEKHNKETFLIKYSGLEEPFIKKVDKEMSKEDKIILINELLKLGCSFDFISKFSNVSKRIINKYKKNLSLNDIKELLKMKKKLQILYVEKPTSVGFNILVKKYNQR